MAQPIEQAPVSAHEQRLMATLGFITELSQVVASNTELKPILDWIVQKTTGMLRADEGSIKLRGPDQNEQPSAKTFISKRSEPGSWPPPVSMSVMGYLLQRGEPLATVDLLDDPRFAGLKGYDCRVRAVLAVPLKVENRITGMLAVTNTTPGRVWTPEEIQLLSIVAANSADVLERARLRAEALDKERLEAENQRMERELSLARDIQMGLVPAAPLRAGPWEVLGRVVPARQVGGDYFDYFKLGEGRFGLTIADVSGKGVPAALLVSNVQASLRAYCDGRRPLSEAIREINRGVARTAAGGKFVTLFYGEVDHRRGLLRYTNAGHNYPLVRRADGSLEELQEGGLPLGLFDNATYEEGEVPFAKGDALLLYSDGVSEAADSLGGEFSEERLRSLWQACAGLPAAEAVARLFAEVERFRGSAGQSDDITAVVVSPPAGS